MDIAADLQNQSLCGQQTQAEEKEYSMKESKGVASRAIHVEIVGFATHIRQLKERLLDPSKEPGSDSQPQTSENHEEEEVFPSWLI